MNSSTTKPRTDGKSAGDRLRVTLDAVAGNVESEPAALASKGTEGNERRHFVRYEPMDLEVRVTWSKKKGETTTEGYVLDLSEVGLAIAFPHGTALPPGRTVDLWIIDHATRADGTQASMSWKIRAAKIVRSWEGGGILNVNPGIAVRYPALSPSSWPTIRRGNQRAARVEAQRAMYAADIANLSETRRNIVSAQVQLFVMCWTIGVALATAYFGLRYTQSLETTGQSFWRMMIGALPGVLALVTMFLSIQQDIMIHKIDSFLAVLKEMRTHDQYPRWYRGWETVYRQYGHILGTSRCKVCPAKCGDIAKYPEKDRIDSIKLLRDPGLDPYYMLLYFGYVIMVVLSFLLIVFELVTSPQGALPYVLAEFAMIAVFLLTGWFIFHYMRQLRGGRYTFLALRRAWMNILVNCQQTI